MADEIYTGNRGTSRGERGSTEGYTAHVPGTGTYSDRGNSISSGLAVYPKADQTVSFFEDQAGTRQVGASGGKGGQSGSPTRSGTELVGFTTGKADPNYIQVSWVNRWWQDVKIKEIFNPFSKDRGAEWKTENKISWVRRSAVSISEKVLTPEQQKEDQDKQNQNNLLSDNGGNSSGIDTTTLGIAAIGAALIYKSKKKRK
jgi:hypothetical protein